MHESYFLLTVFERGNQTPRCVASPYKTLHCTGQNSVWPSGKKRVFMHMGFVDNICKMFRIYRSFIQTLCVPIVWVEVIVIVVSSFLHHSLERSKIL